MYVAYGTSVFFVFFFAMTRWYSDIFSFNMASYKAHQIESDID